MQMTTTKSSSNDSVLKPGYVTVADMAAIVGMKPASFKTWVHHNKHRLDYRVIGNTGIVKIASVFEARKHTRQ